MILFRDYLDFIIVKWKGSIVARIIIVKWFNRRAETWSDIWVVAPSIDSE